MKTHFLFIIIAFLLSSISLQLLAQVSVTPDGRAPDSSAMLDVVSLNKGLLLPRLTHQQIQSIANPANGLLVFCTTDKKFYAFQAGNNVFREISYGSGRITSCCYCGNDLTDQRDGKIYRTILIGNQCWMAQNLNIGIPSDGSVTPQNNGAIEKHCYNDYEDNCNLYGGLYRWKEMMHYVTTLGSQGICPAGWHIPTDEEWTTLISYLGGAGVAGGPMKSTGFWMSPNNGATNTSGFSAFPGGIKDIPGFDKLSTKGYFWSSTNNSDTTAYARELGYDTGTVNRIATPTMNGASVRCVK